MVAIQIEIGQKNTHNTKIQKVLRTDDEFIWVSEIVIHIYFALKNLILWASSEFYGSA